MTPADEIARLRATVDRKDEQMVVLQDEIDRLRRELRDARDERDSLAFKLGAEVATSELFREVVVGLAAQDPIRHESGGCCGESEWSCIGCNATADMGVWDRLGVDFLGLKMNPRPRFGYNEEAIGANFPHADNCLWKLARAALASGNGDRGGK